MNCRDIGRKNHWQAGTKVADIGERDLISVLISPMLSRKYGNVLLDDCAVFQLPDSTLLLSIDQGPGQTFLELLGIGTPEDIGHYYVTINASDIAAMGGQPVGMLLALGLEGTEEASFLEGVLAGIDQAMCDYGIALLGGDTKQAGCRSITISIVGRVLYGKPLERRGVHVGDQVFVTSGQIGRCLYEYLQVARARSTNETGSLYRPMAQVEFGQFLASSKIATSCIDMSDGLLHSANLLGELNGVTFFLDFAAIPMADSPVTGREDDWRNLVLNVGGDFGLMFTTSPANAHIAQQHGACHIGDVRRGGVGLATTQLHEKGISLNAWEHFKTVGSMSDELRSFL